jgi:WD40-like Beta Propeller Repeat
VISAMGWRLPLGALSMAVTIAAVVWPGSGSEAFNAHPSPSGTLVLASAHTIELVSPTSGALERTLPIPSPYELAFDASVSDSQMAVSPDGKTAYVTVASGPESSGVDSAPFEILAVPLDGAKPTVTVSDAVDPAVSPDGTRLAYLEDTLPARGMVLQRPSETVVIFNLKSKTQQMYNLGVTFLEGSGPNAVNGLSWSPFGATLAVAIVKAYDTFGAFDSAGILDSAKALSPERYTEALRPEGNPRPLARGATTFSDKQRIPPGFSPPPFLFGFQSATYMTNGDIALIDAEPLQAQLCSPPVDPCGAVRYTVVSVNPGSGHAKVTFTGPPHAQGDWFAIDQLAIGARGNMYLLGRNDVCNTCQPMIDSPETLFSVAEGIPLRLGRQSGFRAIAWTASVLEHGHLQAKRTKAGSA